MTLREMIALGLPRVTVPTSVSGAPELFHYFADKINDINIMGDCDYRHQKNGWYVEIMDYRCRFYTYESAKQLIDLVREHGESY